VVSAGCTGAGTLAQAKIYRPECSARVALYSEKIIVLLQANISLANIYIGLN